MLESLPADAEILVLDAVGYDDPWNIGEEGVRFISLPAGTAEVTGLNVGIRHALGDIVHPLRAGARVRAGWADEVLPHFENSMVACVAPMLVDPLWQKIVSIGVQFRTNGQIRTIKRYKQFLKEKLAFAPHVVGAFFRRSMLEKLGYFDTSLSLQNAYLDISLMARLFDFETTIETDCCIALLGDRPLPQPSFAVGMEQERLFRRWIGRFQRHASWSHFSYLNAEFWRLFPSPRAVSQLFGRLAAMMSADDRKEHLEKCETIRTLISSGEVSPEIPAQSPERPENTIRSARPTAA